MFGQNPIRKPEKGDGSRLKIQEIFPTLQGEGPHTGVASVFVRLGGCNLACDFCDTEFESFSEMSVDEILHEVVCFAEGDADDVLPIENEGGQQADSALSIGEANSPCENQQIFAGQPNNRKRQLVVITGGEPLRQNIIPLCEGLIEEGFLVQIETNGTLWRGDLPAAVEVICSPKAGLNGYGALRGDIIPYLRALKYIISKTREPYTHVPSIPQTVETWLQPMDEGDATKNQQNLEYVTALAEQHGYKVSIQTHKVFSLD